MKYFLLSVFIISAVFGYSQDNDIPSAVKKALEHVDTNIIRSDIAYLADDKLKGRLPGTEGYQMAMDYIVAQYKKTGLQPAGEHNSYLQEVILRKAFLDTGSIKILWKDANGTTESFTKKNFQVLPHPLKKSVSVSAPLVFAGYGVEIPGQYSDYTGIDVKGKIVIVLRGTPPGLHSTLAAHFNSPGNKMLTAFAKGAIGLLIAATAPPVAPTSTTPVAATTTPMLTVALNQDNNIAYGRSSTGVLDLVANISFSNLNYLLTATGKKADDIITVLKNGTPQSFAMKDSISVSYNSTYSDLKSYNIIGKIEGTDPKLKNEYVVHTAHLDHLGIGKPVNGDSIYNGAHDNASGVASLLEIGRLYKTKGVKTRRSVLIVMVTGEEMGLLGSAYFTANPTVPKSSIVAGINTDMPTIILPLLSVVPLGAEHSSLMKNVEFAASYLKLDIEKDPEPAENRFVRSDQYNFVIRGIPALHIKYGNKSAIPGLDMLKYVKEWREKYYHKTADGMDGLFNFTAAKTYVQLNFLVSYSIAQSDEKPEWNKGDLFGL
jgi:hypothetical protein